LKGDAVDTEVVIAGFVIPGFVAAAVAGLWNLLAQRELRAIESRLRREEEAFRLSQSPRVRAAVELWRGFCEYERCLRALVTPFSPLLPDDLSGEEQRQMEREAWQRQQEEALAALRLAWKDLKKARDEAECLLEGEVFERFEGLYRSCDAAQREYWAGRSADFGRPERERTEQDVEVLLGEAARQRPGVVEAIRAMIAPPTPR
jgi:hypothetical protein